MNMNMIAAIALIANGMSFNIVGTAQAGDSDDVHCYEVEYGGVDIMCDFVDELKAECKLNGDTGDSDVCAEVNPPTAEARLPGVRIKNVQRLKLMTN